MSRKTIRSHRRNDEPLKITESVAIDGLAEGFRIFRLLGSPKTRSSELQSGSRVRYHLRRKRFRGGIIPFEMISYFPPHRGPKQQCNGTLLET